MKLTTMIFSTVTAYLLVGCGSSSGQTSTPGDTGGSGGGGADGPVARSVTGRAVNVQGQPMAGVEIWVKPSIYSWDSVVKTTSNTDGRYKIESLLDMPYNIRAWKKLEYQGASWCLRLAHENLTDYDSFSPKNGTTRNFVWRTTGKIPDLQNAHFGGEVRVLYRGNTEDPVVRLTFVPTGPLIDGSTGSTVVREVRVSELDLTYDVPIGPYNVTAQLVESGGSTPLRIGAKDIFTYGNSADLKFKPDGLCQSNGSGVQRAFLFVAEPGFE